MLKNVADIYPLTSMQQMMLVRTLGDRQSSLFVEQLTATFEGRLDIDNLRQAWQQASERHPALRTAIVWQGLERPLQVVREHVELPLVVHDWQSEAPGVREQRFDEWTATAKREPFDLARPPLVRIDLFLLGHDRYHFSCRAHHLLFDGWSLAILMAQVLEIYGSLIAGRRAPDRKQPGFREYVAWLDRQDPAAAEAFWRSAVTGFYAPTPIGFMRAREGDAPPTYGSHVTLVPKDGIAALTSWLRQNQLTLSAAIHAAWAILLARHSGRRDVVFGATVSGRPADLPEVERMIGPFINNVPLRVALTDEQSVLNLLKEVQASLAGVAAYQHTPLADIERWCDLERHVRLFESLVVLENYPRASADLESSLGLRVIDLNVSATTVYPLSLVVLPERFSLDLRYDRLRFTDEEAANLAEELCEVLTFMPKLGERSVGDLLAKAPQSADAGRLWNQTSSSSEGHRTAQLSSEYVAPRDAIERTLAAVWSELTGREKVGVRDNFFELGGDSLMAVRLMSEVERQFGRKLPLVWLFQDPTIERLADVLRSGDQPAMCLVPIRPGAAGSRPPLFCAHPAGGTVFCYRELARLLPEDQPVYGLQARGIDGREPPRARLEEMAADYVAEIRTAQTVGPYWLLGWSLGGLVVFEMARQLVAAGQQTALVAIIDAGMIAPGKSFTEDDFVPMLLQLFPDELRPSEEELKSLKPDEQLDFFRVRAERARLVALNDSPIEDQHVFQVFQANMTALLDYRPQPFSGRLTLFRARQDATPMHRERYMGWEPWALGGVDEHRIEGEHVNLFREPYISQLAAELIAVITAGERKA